MGAFACLRSAGWRRAGGLVLVCALVCAALPASAVAEVSPPVASGVLSGVGVAVGATVSVDASVGFSGSVDSYAARSSDEAVVSVVVSGSVVSLRGVAVGDAHVTVQATNSAGSAWQRFAVRVEAVPAPTLREALGDWSLHVGAAESVALAAVFAGTVVAYSAASSDEGVASVSVSGSVMSVTGVGAGSAAVRYTATNAGGSASSSLTVTVAADPPAAPTVAGALAARTLEAGSAAAVDVAAGFAGVVDSYEATSSDETRLAVAVAGSVVSLTALSAGAVTVTVFAANSAGSVSQTFNVAVVSGLKVAAAAPAYCLTGEGRPVVVSSSAAGSAAGAGASTLGREGVASVEVAYTVSGGRGPYTVVVGDGAAGAPATDSPAAGTRLSLPAAGGGEVEVSCARAGVNLNDVAARANAVEAGPKTVRLAVRDADGATAAAEVTFTVAEDVYTTAYNGGTMRAGRTYVIGDPDAWAHITLPAGLDLRFEGISMGEYAHFADTATNSTITLDWRTGAENSRSIETPDAAATVSRNFDALAASAARPAGIVYDAALRGRGQSWRPYPGLPDEVRVGLHQFLLKGATIHVCDTTPSDEETPKDTPAPENQAAFDTALSNAVGAWNKAAGPSADRKKGTIRPIFTESCVVPVTIEDKERGIVKEYGIIYVVPAKEDVKSDGKKCEANVGCAWNVIIGPYPPTVTGDLVQITTNDPKHYEWAITHELGH
ncbi:MAG: hypothetical protein OXP08_08350, partial [bacterium]|nr:hypothetical protein [bacterium]